MPTNECLAGEDVAGFNDTLTTIPTVNIQLTCKLGIEAVSRRGNFAADLFARRIHIATVVQRLLRIHSSQPTPHQVLKRSYVAVLQPPTNKLTN
jgi:hypothetical protein